MRPNLSGDERPTAPRHSRLEDTHALLIGASFVAFGLVMLKTAGLITGGLAGVALVISYMTGWPAGPVFLMINLPFFLLASRRMGAEFTVKSIIALTALAALTVAMPRWLVMSHPSLSFDAVFAGSLIGIGVLSLARHRASVGGIGIVALYVQQARGTNAGIVQLVCDVMVIASASVVLDGRHIAYSALSALALNLVMIAYHRPGRYAGH